MSLPLSSAEGRQSLYLWRPTAAELETMKQAAKEIVGTWTVESATLYHNEAEEGTPLTDCAYTLTVLEDGTYTAQFSETFSGTWVCNNYTYRKYNYTFAHGTTSYGYGIDENGLLHVWDHPDDSSSVDVIMKKN